jgi:hypothetical protein
MSYDGESFFVNKCERMNIDRNMPWRRDGKRGKLHFGAGGCSI